MKIKHAALFIPACYEDEAQVRVRKRNGFEQFALKIGSTPEGDIFRLYFDGLLTSRVYLLLGKVINSKWQDIGELKVWSRDETYVDIIIPIQHGCMFILIAP